ncbi:MAG: type II secretion system F family protein [Pseudomonadota bacterium]
MGEITVLITDFLDRFSAALVEEYGEAAPFYAIASISIIMVLVAIPLVLRGKKDPLDRFNFREERLQGELVKLRDADASSGGLADYLQPTDKKQMSDTRKMLRQAGFDSAGAVRSYYTARFGLCVGLTAVGAVLFLIAPAEPNLVFGTVMTLVLGFVGFLGPVYWVQRSIATRREDIQKAFPDAMDMMLVCIEGGQSLDQAMSRVGKEMEAAAGPLAYELGIVSQEFRVGKDRITVLRDFAERCNVNDISSFVTVMIQSTAFGTSISQALRVYASEMRDKRLMRAEEKANKLPTKLTLGTMFFTVPPLILILVGPSLIQILRAFAQLGG